MPLKDKGQAKAYSHTYHQNHKEAIAARHKKWIEENKERHCKYHKEYNREHYKEHRDEVAARRIKWRMENKDKHNANQISWRLKNPARQLLYYAKGRAKKIGVPFDLKEEDVIVPEYCPVLGIKLRYGAVSLGNRQASQDSPSLDRIRPELGYVKGNVIVVSWRANALKKDATVAELNALAAFYSGLDKLEKANGR